VLAYLGRALATNVSLYRSHLEVTGLLVKLSPEIAVADLELPAANPYLTNGQMRRSGISVQQRAGDRFARSMRKT
jgi:hypothetical protein